MGGAAQGENGKVHREISASDPFLSREEDTLVRGCDTCCTPRVVFLCFQMVNKSYLFVAHTWGDAQELACGLSPRKQTHFLERRFLFTAWDLREPQKARCYQRVQAPSPISVLLPSPDCHVWLTREPWIPAFPPETTQLAFFFFLASVHIVAVLSQRWIRVPG